VGSAHGFSMIYVVKAGTPRQGVRQTTVKAICQCGQGYVATAASRVQATKRARGELNRHLHSVGVL
jgi:hypothetical protein